MSRLDSFIRRISAQRDILNELKMRLDGTAGPIFEFGMGNGRTYDHMREHFPGRRIVVFECVAYDMPHLRFPLDDIVRGDIRETASRFPDRCAAMIHADIETGDPERDAELATWLPAVIARLLVPGGFAASGSALPDPRLAPLPLPLGIMEHRYHVVRRVASAGDSPAFRGDHMLSSRPPGSV